MCYSQHLLHDLQPHLATSGSSGSQGEGRVRGEEDKVLYLASGVYRTSDSLTPFAMPGY